MGENVNTPWAGEVDHVDDMGDADFERRSDYLSLQEASGKGPGIAVALAEEWDISEAKAADRAVRLFLAHLLDIHEFPNAREEHDIKILIPPSGWVANFESLNIQYSPQESSLSISVPPTVRELVEFVVESDEITIDSKADFLRTALYWIVGEFETEAQINEVEDQSKQINQEKTIEAPEREISPSYVQILYASEARQLLTDFFLKLDETDQPLTKQDIIDQTGLQRKTVIEHIDVLVALGIVNENDEHRWTRYKPAIEKAPYQAVLEANYVLAEYYN